MQLEGSFFLGVIWLVNNLEIIFYYVILSFLARGAFILHKQLNELFLLADITIPHTLRYPRKKGFWTRKFVSIYRVYSVI